MGVITYPSGADLKVLDALKGVGAHLTGSKLGLFSNDIMLSSATAVGDLTPCAFTGYALSAAVTLGTSYIDENGIPTLPATSLAFNQSGIGALDTARGAYLVGDPSGTPRLAAAQKFSSPVSFDRTGRGKVIVPAYQIVRSGTPVWKVPVTDQLAILNALIATGKLLDGVGVMLWQNNYVPTVQTTLADLTACTFTGYSAVDPVVWAAASTPETAGGARVLGASVQFQQTARTTDNTAYGWALVGDPGGTPYLLCAQRFDIPVQFNLIGRAVNIVPEFDLPLAV